VREGSRRRRKEIASPVSSQGTGQRSAGGIPPASDDTGDFAPWLSLVGGLCGCSVHGCPVTVSQGRTGLPGPRLSLPAGKARELPASLPSMAPDAFGFKPGRL
jgi:hypothetical protein